jgi:hypothetical protein
MEQTQNEMAKHREALVKLGYFEKRDFALTQGPYHRSGTTPFGSLVANAKFSDNHWEITTVANEPFIITVTALRMDMPVWSNLVSRFDSGNAQITR